MRKIRHSNENEMVYEFLKMEITSGRHQKQIESILATVHTGKDIITNGDILSAQENALRAEILRRFRGYRNEKLFEKFPTKIDWIWTEFDQEDIAKIIYTEYSYWNKLSNYTGSPLEAAKTISAGITVYGVSNDRAIEGAKRLREGNKFSPLIFLTNENEQCYIILEGHSRMTSYGLVPNLFQNVSVLLGYCDSDELNEWYGERPAGP
ncbi:MAG: hypothetical protein FWE06_08730 [Oscillospiraceae bacterium]|nr:hypothetical protein [Oscillospiraceae bacterium]